MRITTIAAALLILYAAPSTTTARAAQSASAPTTDADIERFLRDARVVRTHATSKGVTGSIRATLTDGSFTHDAHIQSIDEKKTQFQSMSGVEFNFRDSWTFNIAAYRLDRLIGLQLVPVSVERHWQSHPSAFTWWVDDVMMEEGDRLKKKISPPRTEEWNEQMQLVRLFDQLIYNVDRNVGNLLITKDWRIWAIDHTRAFRLQKALKSPANVTRCDRQVLAKLKELDKATLKRELGRFLADWDIDAVLARRDAIVQIIEKGGPTAVFDRTPISSQLQLSAISCQPSALSRQLPAPSSPFSWKASAASF